MAKEIIREREIHYECKECKLIYKNKEIAEKCEKWCKKHKSCSLDITKYAVNKTSK